MPDSNHLHDPCRLFDPHPEVRALALSLYNEIKDLPLICPHGHVDPGIFARNNPFSDPAALFIIPDHYVFRMLYSQHIPLEDLGIQPLDGSSYEQDPRIIWQTFADHFYLFAGTPSGLWLSWEFNQVFGIPEKLTPGNAMEIYDRILDKLSMPEFLPRSLFEKFNIEVLTTTDSAADTLTHHKTIRESGWQGRIIPCFRPDDVTNLLQPGWQTRINRLSEITSISITSYTRFIQALEKQREYFKELGGVSTDHGIEEPYIHKLSPAKADEIFTRALHGDASEDDARVFTGHMMMEMARMSCEDGLVMHIHPGCFRNHNNSLYKQFGPDKGSDIPLAVEFTRNLRELLTTYGNNPVFTLVLFTLDETAYSRELAPLAGHYPALRIGPAWWFHDSFQGMKRHREQVLETAGVYNLVGFIDDTRAFASIPIRHEVARRIDSNFLAGLVVRHIIDEKDALRMNKALAYDLSKQTYTIPLPRRW